MKQLKECLINEAAKLTLKDTVNPNRLSTSLRGCDIVLFDMLINFMNDGNINKSELVNYYMNLHKNDASKYDDLGKNALKTCDFKGLEKTLGLDAADYLE